MAKKKTRAAKGRHVEKYVRILNAAIDELDGDIVLRGRIDPVTLDAIKVDDYQREVLSLSSRNRIREGLEKGDTVPDLELSMRGYKTKNDDESYVLLDPVYVVDGLQRMTTGIEWRDEGKGDPRIGATIHFGKNKAWE